VGNAREAMRRHSLRTAKGDQCARGESVFFFAGPGDGSTSNESRRGNDDKAAILLLQAEINARTNTETRSSCVCLSGGRYER
jgi:hypothetical protein